MPDELPETEEERTARLTQFVLNVCDSEIFTSNQVDEHTNLSMVFMVLALMPEPLPEDTVLVWEYLSKAGPRSVNGYPCFWSCHFMNKADWGRCLVAIKAELERREKSRAEIKV